MRDGACVGAETARFFGSGSGGRLSMKGLPCLECPVAPECERYASKEGLSGIWGGRYFSL